MNGQDERAHTTVDWSECSSSSSSRHWSSFLSAAVPHTQAQSTLGPTRHAHYSNIMIK